MSEMVSHILLDASGRPIEPLADLMRACKLHPDQDIDGIDAQLQAHWIAKNAEARYQIGAGGVGEGLVPQIWAAAEAIGLTKKRTPKKEEYDGILIFGALMTAVEGRIRFVLESEVTGPIYALGNKRPLNDIDKRHLQSLEIDINGLITEADGMRALMKKLELPGEILESRDRINEFKTDGSMRPANLGDTIEDLCDNLRKANGGYALLRSFLMVYSAPFFASGLLQASLRARAPQATFEIIGPEISEALKAKPLLILDELAKAWRNEMLRVKAGVGNVAKIVWEGV